MYKVSDSYKQALKSVYIEDRIDGCVRLGDSTEIPITDGTLVRNSLKISHELCGEYKIGTFNLGCLQMSFFDDDALLHDFSDARIILSYQIKLEDDWEDVPLGIFTADGSTVRRRGNIVSLTAYDSGILFDKLIPEEMREAENNAMELIALACQDCGVELLEPPELPNADVRLSLASRQVQTYRDLIAWCVSLMCGYAMIDREGKLKIIPAKYSVEEDDSSSIIIDRHITETERDSVYVTDTRAYIKRLNAYCGNMLKNYVSEIVPDDDQAAEAVYRLPKNPLIPPGLEDSEYDAMNLRWLSFIDGFKQRGVTAEIYGDPAIDLGDTLRCRGGDIDQRRSIVGVVTKQEWRYRDRHTVICAAPQLCGSVADKPDVVIDQLEKKLSNVGFYTAGRGISINGSNKIEARIGRGLAFDDEGKIICTASGGLPNEHYFFNFYFDDYCAYGSYARTPLVVTEGRPMLAIVSNNIMSSTDPDSADFLKHDVWFCGTADENGGNSGWILIAPYPDNGKWYVNFGVPFGQLLYPAQRAEAYERLCGKYYNCLVICE